MQFELFTEAGAIVAERALHAGESREAVAEILRRAGEQVESLMHGQRAAVRSGD